MTTSMQNIEVLSDPQDERTEHLNELRLAKKYEETPEHFYMYGRWHDHSCCPDCCGCADEYSVYLTLEEWLHG